MRLLTEFILSGDEGFGVTWPPILVAQRIRIFHSKIDLEIRQFQPSLEPIAVDD